MPRWPVRPILRYHPPQKASVSAQRPIQGNDKSGDSPKLKPCPLPDAPLRNNRRLVKADGLFAYAKNVAHFL